MISYPGRRGRLTAGQTRATENNLDNILDIDQISQFFTSLADERDTRPIGVEIGFGTGHALIEWARQKPEWLLIGIELYDPGIGSLMVRKNEQLVENIFVFRGDAREVFEKFDDNQIQEIRCFFPDPWPKTRHHKRRLINSEFVRLATTKLVPGGQFLLASDWQDYAAVMLKVLSGESGLENLFGDEYAPRANVRPHTRFEDKGIKRGHEIRDLCFHKKADTRLSK